VTPIKTSYRSLKMPPLTVKRPSLLWLIPVMAYSLQYEMGLVEIRSDEVSLFIALYDHNPPTLQTDVMLVASVREYVFFVFFRFQKT